jgi:hypothetical protein
MTYVIFKMREISRITRILGLGRHKTKAAGAVTLPSTGEGIGDRRPAALQTRGSVFAVLSSDKMPVAGMVLSHK